MLSEKEIQKILNQIRQGKDPAAHHRKFRSLVQKHGVHFLKSQGCNEEEAERLVSAFFSQHTPSKILEMPAEELEPFQEKYEQFLRLRLIARRELQTDQALADLAARGQKGDQQAWNLLYMSLEAKFLTQVMLKWLPHHAEARDLCAKAFEAMRKSLQNQPDRRVDHVAGFFYKSLTTSYLQQLRKPKIDQASDSFTDLEHPDGTPFDLAAEDLEVEQERFETIKKISIWLKEKGKSECWEILRLFYLEGYSWKEVSKKLGSPSEDAIKVKAGRCLKFLRKNL